MRIEGSIAIPLVAEQERLSPRSPLLPNSEGAKADESARKASPHENSLKMKRETADGNSTVYQLVDDNTGAIVAQVPSQQVLNVAEGIEQLIQQEMEKPKLDVKS